MERSLTLKICLSAYCQNWKQHVVHIQRLIIPRQCYQLLIHLTSVQNTWQDKDSLRTCRERQETQYKIVILSGFCVRGWAWYYQALRAAISSQRHCLTPPFRELQWLKVPDRYRFVGLSTVAFVQAARHSTLLRLSEIWRWLTTSSSFWLYVHASCTVDTSDHTGRQSISSGTARAWNALPASVRTSSSYLAFRQDLKTILFKASFDDWRDAPPLSRMWLLGLFCTVSLQFFSRDNDRLIFAFITSSAIAQRPHDARSQSKCFQLLHNLWTIAFENAYNTWMASKVTQDHRKWRNSIGRILLPVSDL